MRDRRAQHIAVIVAAGRGTRMQSDRPKVLLDLAGRPVLAHTLDAFVKCPWMDAVIAVAPEEYLDDVWTLIGRLDGCDGADKSVTVVRGGAERADSVRAGLTAALSLNRDRAYVYIHDGARPLIPQEVLERVRDGVERTGACVCGVPVKDTIRGVTAAGGPNDDAMLAGTLDRQYLRAIQTPQAFDLAEIAEAYDRYMRGEAQPASAATDDAMIYEAATGRQVLIVDGDYANIKLTTPGDMVTAEAFLAGRDR